MDDYTYLEVCETALIEAEKMMNEVRWGEHIEARRHRDECQHNFNVICERLFNPPSL